LGRRAAKSVNIRFNPELSFIEKTSKPQPAGLGDCGDHKPMLKQKYLPPESSLNTILAYNPDYLNDTNAPHTFQVLCTYKDLNDNEYSEKYEISLSSIVYGKKTAEFSKEYFYRELFKKIDDLKDATRKTRM
jgi:hypothetical protein